MDSLEQKKPKTLQQKIDESKAKTVKLLKEQKAKKQAELRQKQKQEEKELLKIVLHYKKQLNNDLLLLTGCLQNGVNALAKNEIQKLDYFRGLVQKENS